MCMISSSLKFFSFKVVVKLNEFKPQELSNVLWAFASLEFHDPIMVDSATNLAAHMAPHFKEQELSNVIWAMGRCDSCLCYFYDQDARP